jgi:hypothetical protein
MMWMGLRPHPHHAFFTVAFAAALDTGAEAAQRCLAVLLVDSMVFRSAGNPVDRESGTLADNKAVVAGSMAAAAADPMAFWDFFWSVPRLQTILRGQGVKARTGGAGGTT